MYVCFSCAQVYSQPFFGILEAPFRARRPADEPLPLWLQFGMRVVYVVITTVVALVVSYLICLTAWQSACGGLSKEVLRMWQYSKCAGCDAG